MLLLMLPGQSYLVNVICCNQAIVRVLAEVIH